MGLSRRRRIAHSDDLLGSSLGSEHGEDTSSASDIENDLVPAITKLVSATALLAEQQSPCSLEEVLVPPHRVAVGERANLILEHLLVDTEVSVRVGVVVRRGHRLRRRIMSSEVRSSASKDVQEQQHQRQGQSWGRSP